MSDSPEGRSPRQGRARDRIRRRHEKQQATDQGPLRPTMPHLDTERFKVNLTLPRVPGLQYVLYTIVGILITVGVVLFLGQLAGRTTPSTPTNAIWIGTEWTYAVHEPEDVAALAAHLRNHQIGTVYAWVSWLQPDLTWRGAENFGAVQAFVRQFKEAYPEAELMGWLGFPVEGVGIEYRLDDADIQQNIADFSGRVVREMGFDGLFLNVEPVWSGDDNFLDLLRKVRVDVGDGVPVAVAIPPDWSPIGVDIPVPPLIAPGTVWSREYKQSVALLTEQMAVMAYNSGLASPEDYAVWVAYQVTAFVDAVSALGGGTQILIGIPTDDAEPPGHDPLVENIESAIAGLRLGLAELGDRSTFVRGAAIYAGWTTTEEEWATFREVWAGR